MNLQELSNQNWEKFVGRRQPPLRGELALKGTLNWFSKNGFKEDLSKLYIYFSEITDKGIISNHYINNDLRKVVVEKFRDIIREDINLAMGYLDEWQKDTIRLKEFSISLDAHVGSGDADFVELFDEFCRVWEQFGPNLYVFLLLIEGCEKAILDDFLDDEVAKTRLLTEVGAGVRSEFFASQEKKEPVASNFGENYQPFIKLLRQMMEYRDKRKVVYDDSWYKYSAKFFTELEKRIGMGERVYFLSKEKIKQALNGERVGDGVEMPCLVYAQGSQIQYAYGVEVRSLETKIIQNTAGSCRELKGIIACSGRASGFARLIEPHVQNQKFEEGEILVTRMTTPDLMPLIKMAAAIVTDEGGMTCHAAIVARELKKPCIIGTKIATQVLKDGDEVEVDADNGIIRKV